MHHLEQDHDDEVACYNYLFSIDLALLFYYIAIFVGNNGVKKHFNFTHGNNKMAFRFNGSGANNKF